VTNISVNGTQQLVITSPSVSATPANKARGEERFTIYSKADYQNPPLILDTQFIQIWPIADGSISGINEGATVGADAPDLTVTLNDLYPSSTTYAILYQGSPVANPSGTTVPGSQVVIQAAEPMNREVVLSNYAHLIDSNGTWTLDVLTDTPFGTDRIMARSFNVEGLLTPDVWRQTHFDSPDNTGDGADTFDFDSDGLSNILEYAMGLDPTQKNIGMNPTIRLVGENAEISLSQSLAVRGITIGAEWSETLGDDWQPIANTGTFPDYLFQKLINGVPRGFMRIKISLSP
jgi:hypothetical protein